MMNTHVPGHNHLSTVIARQANWYNSESLWSTIQDRAIYKQWTSTGTERREETWEVIFCTTHKKSLTANGRVRVRVRVYIQHHITWQQTVQVPKQKHMVTECTELPFKYNGVVLNLFFITFFISVDIDIWHFSFPVNDLCSTITAHQAATAYSGRNTAV